MKREEFLLIAILAVPYLMCAVAMARLGYRNGTNPYATWMSVVARAMIWSLPLAWTWLAFVGHGVALIPVPWWVALIFSLSSAPEAAVVPAWIPPAGSVAVYLLGACVGHRRRELDYE